MWQNMQTGTIVSVISKNEMFCLVGVRYFDKISAGIVEADVPLREFREWFKRIDDPNELPLLPGEVDDPQDDPV